MRGILFDAGNTLVYVDPARVVDLYRAEGVESDVATFAAAELVARRILHERIEHGATGQEPELWRAYFLRLFTLSGVPDDAIDAVSERIRRAHAEEHLWTHALPGTNEVLGALRAAGYRLGVISNADGRMEGALASAGLREEVEFVLDSGAFGVEKPSARIFQAGCDALGLPAEACVYVGDLFPVDYVGARAAGLGALLLDPLGVHAERAETVGRLAEVEGWLGPRAAVPPLD